MISAIITLLDTSKRNDAAACGYDAEADGLKVAYESDPQVGCCVYLSKYGASIDLYGDAEIKEVIRALNLALSRNAAKATRAAEAA